MILWLARHGLSLAGRQPSSFGPVGFSPRAPPPHSSCLSSVRPPIQLHSRCCWRTPSGKTKREQRQRGRAEAMAAACSFRSIARAPPPPRGLARRAVRCCSAAPGGASTSKLVLEVKERLEREHPGLPTGRGGRDDEEMILWFLKDRKFAVDEAVLKLTKAVKWRQGFRVSELSEESVKGLYQTGKAYVHDSFDIYNRPVLVVVAAKHFPSKQDPVENEKLCAFLVEKALSRLPKGADNILGIFDLRGFRVENGDLQFLKFLAPPSPDPAMEMDVCRGQVPQHPIFVQIWWQRRYGSSPGVHGLSRAPRASTISCKSSGESLRPPSRWSWPLDPATAMRGQRRPVRS